MKITNLTLAAGGLLSLALLPILSLAAIDLCSAQTPAPVAAAPTAAPVTPVAAIGKPLVLNQVYVKGVNDALHTRHDVWGDQVLARPGGPTYDNVKDYLVPLMHGDPDLTDSGIYYIPFGQPHGKQDLSLENALHVADGSQFYSNSPANNPFSEQYGNTWNFYVGAEGDELYGSTLGRLKLPDLADGYPILQTEYVDSQGVRYRQESFVARTSEISDAAGFGNLVSWIRVAVEPGAPTTKQTLLNFVPSKHRPSGRFPKSGDCSWASIT